MSDLTTEEIRQFRELMMKGPSTDLGNRSKPDVSVPALRKKLAAVQKESHELFQKIAADDYAETPEDEQRADQLTQDQERLQGLLARAEKWNIVDNAANGRQNTSFKTGLLPHEDPSNVGTRHQYSLMRAMRAKMHNEPLAGLELEVHQEMEKQRPLANPDHRTRGINIPLDLPIDMRASLRYARRSGAMYSTIADMINVRQSLEAERRALDTVAGAGAIPTIVDTTLIELLRPRMVTYSLGARTMLDMQGLFAIPRQTQASQFYMVAQGGSITASNQTIDQVPFSPHTGGAYTTYTRQFLEQTNQDAEMFVREDLSAVVARGVETAAFNGQGSLGFPLGLLQNPQIDVYAIGGNGGAPTWTQLVAMEGAVAYFNADVGALAYVTDALTRATLKTTLKISGSNFPIYLWNTEAPDFPVNGYPCAITNLLPQNLTKGSGTSLHTMIYGNWEDLIYAFWSGLDVIVDPYTAAPQGAVNIIALQDFDVNVRHYQSFANCVDIQMAAGISTPIT